MSKSAAGISGYLLVLLVVYVAYGFSLNNAFTYDDIGLILQDPRVHSGDWRGILSQSYWGDKGDGLYRPITTASLALNWWVCQDRVWGYHLTNLILHSSIGIMLLYIGRRTEQEKTGLVVALIYCLHPGPSEAVFSVVGRAELLACCCGLAAIICCVRQLQDSGPGLRWRLGIFVALLCAILAKENGVVFAGGIVVWRIFLNSKLDNIGGIAILATVAALVVKWLAIGTFQPESIGYLDNPLAYESVDSRLANAFSLFIRSVLKLIFPYPLVVDYSPQQIPLFAEFTMPDVWVPMLLVVSLGGWAVVLMIKRPEYAIWSTLSAGGILLVSNMFVVTGTIFAERLLYIPALGFSMALGRLLNRSPARIQISFIASWTCIAVSILWGRGEDWRSELSLFTSAVEAHPLSARSHYGLGLALHRESKLRPALQEYDQALNLYPRYFEARLNRGAVLLELGKYPDAIAAYRDVVDQRPMHFQGRYALALLEFNFGDRSLAKSMLWQLHGEFPRRIDLLCDLVKLLAGQGDRTEALRLLAKGLILEPANEELLLLEQAINSGVD